MSTDTSGPTVRVTGLFIYPVKSCRGLDLAEVTVTARGFDHDREWMVVRPDGQFITQRDKGALARIRPALTADRLVLSCEGHGSVEVPYVALGRRSLQVQVWKHTCAAWDEGEEVARWLSGILGEPVRLVRFDEQHRRLSSSEWTRGIEAENRFTDGYPILVLSEESVADLGARLCGEPLPMNRFRPNLTFSGAGPYAEDVWREIVGPGLRLRMVKPCVRCRITTIDQETGVGGAEPLTTLAKYRRDAELKGIVFAQNAVLVEGAGLVLRRGMELRLAGSPDPRPS